MPLDHVPPERPPCTIPLGHPSAPAPSTLYHESNLDWRSVSHVIIYMFQCHSPISSHPRPLPQSPKDTGRSGTGGDFPRTSQPRTPARGHTVFPTQCFREASGRERRENRLACCRVGLSLNPGWTSRPGGGESPGVSSPAGGPISAPREADSSPCFSPSHRPTDGEHSHLIGRKPASLVPTLTEGSVTVF